MAWEMNTGAPPPGVAWSAFETKWKVFPLKASCKMNSSQHTPCAHYLGGADKEDAKRWLVTLEELQRSQS